MADEREKDPGGEIHSRGTVPPPPGGDAYEEPTKVGEMSSALWKAVSAHLAPEGHAIPERPGKSTDAPPSAKDDTEKEAGPAADAAPPSIYDGEDDGNDNATLLHPAAKRFALPAPSLPPARVTPMPFQKPLLQSSARPAPMISAMPPPHEPRVPEMVGPGPNDKAWPFAPGFVAIEAADRRRTLVVAGAAAFVGVLIAVIVWLWV
jgi:hypothetical protein